MIKTTATKPAATNTKPAATKVTVPQCLPDKQTASVKAHVAGGKGKPDYALGKDQLAGSIGKAKPAACISADKPGVRPSNCPLPKRPQPAAGALGLDSMDLQGGYAPKTPGARRF